MSGVHVRLALLNRDEEVAPIYGAMTDDAGRFSMAAIQTGVSYQLEAERAGFLLFPTVEQAPSSVIQAFFKSQEMA